MQSKIPIPLIQNGPPRQFQHQINGNLEAGLRLEANVPSGFGFLGQANLSTEAKLEGRMLKGSDKIEWNASWGGLVGKVSLGIWYLIMDNIIEVSQQLEILLMARGLVGKRCGLSLIKNKYDL